MPIDVVFSNINKKDVQYKEMNYRGQLVEVVEYQNKVFLNRIITTNPKQYLNPNLQLGKVIKKWKFCKKIM